MSTGKLSGDEKRIIETILGADLINIGKAAVLKPEDAEAVYLTVREENAAKIVRLGGDSSKRGY